ncbi:MAG: hypothetical protein ACXVC7_08630 [Bacteroidia bacterium]
MKSKIMKACLIALTLTTVTECKKKSSTPEEEPAVVTPTPTPINTIAEVFSSNGVQAQTTNVSATAAQSFSVSGVKIDVPSNAFKTASGGTVTGNVDVSIKGILTKKDIILTGAPANGGSSNRLISTKGCIKVSASQNGQTLRLNPGQNFYVNVMESGSLPATSARKFIATKISTADSTLCWNADPDSLNIPTYLDTLSGKYYYRARIDSANWLNVGQKWDTTATKTAVTVTLATTFNKTNTAVYISLNGIMVVGNLYEISPNVFRISNIPVGRAVNLVAIAVINGQYYSAIVSTTTTLGFSQSMTLQATTLSAIQSALTVLP